jgi:hypothetical protein
MLAGDVIAQAVLQSYDNRPTVLEAEPELLVQLGLAFAGYYRIVTKENPSLFAEQLALTWSINGWDIPDNVDTVIRLERSNGVEVVVVPLEDRSAEPSVGAVYRLGRRYYPAGNTNDPTNQTLTAYIAPVAPEFVALSDPLPSVWPTQFNRMPILELAAFLASKDGRADDAQRFNSALLQWQLDFVRWCQTPDLPIRRRFGAPTIVPTSATRPVGVAGS